MALKKQRLIMILFSLFSMGSGVALFLIFFQENLIYFYGPSEIPLSMDPQKVIRIGGLVQKGSVVYSHNPAYVQFQVTDQKAELTVEYEGVLPDLFREGQGVVIEGRLKSKGIFKACQVLAKHDENYMPPEAMRALTKASKQSLERSLRKE